MVSAPQITFLVNVVDVQILGLMDEIVGHDHVCRISDFRFVLIQNDIHNRVVVANASDRYWTSSSWHLHLRFGLEQTRPTQMDGWDASIIYCQNRHYGTILWIPLVLNFKATLKYFFVLFVCCVFYCFLWVCVCVCVCVCARVYVCVCVCVCVCVFYDRFRAYDGHRESIAHWKSEKMKSNP